MTALQCAEAARPAAARNTTLRAERTMKMKYVSLFLCCVLLSFAPGTAFAVTEDSVQIIEAEGWLESAYVKWTGFDGADGYNVYVKPEGGEYSKIDDELVREYPDYFRADALGLPSGKYVLRVVPVSDSAEIDAAASETEALECAAYVREGFAFSDNSPHGTSGGAYNDDGSLKADADVLYVTNGNKDTVMLNNDPSLGVGLTEILAYRQAKKIKSTLAIRLLGKVEEPAGMEIHTAQFQNTGNVTLEGVGDDAVIYGWIMTLKRAENFEIRNLGMMYGGEGTTGSAIVLDTDNKNVWVHNCDFFYGAPGRDADQIKGDGAVDIKSRSSYVTIDYNHFWDLGKTCVSGGPWENSNMYDERAQIYVTYHHNWFDHTDSRHPRCVVGSNHVYNNYYDGVAMYGIGAAMKTSVFSENNYYRNCPRPMIIASQGSDCYDEASGEYKDKGTLSGQMGGMIKSYGDVIDGYERFYPYGSEPVEGEFDAYIAQSRGEAVPDTVKAKKGDEAGCAVYNNFDTNPDVMYEYQVDTPEAAVEKIKKYAGRVGGGDFKWTFNNETDDPDHSVNQALLDAIKSYESKLISVAGGTVVPPVVSPEPTGTADPDATPQPTVAPPGDISKMPIGAVSYAKDWFGQQSMSAGDISLDGYVGCYKGNGNSYKSNSFSAGGEAMTRGYQVKQLDARSFYIIPESECMVTIYFYSSGSRRLGVYTESAAEPAGVYTPETSGDFAYTYHFTEVGSPLYIAGLDGDINLAGIRISAAEEADEYDYSIESAVIKDGALNIELKYRGAEQVPSARLIVAEYSGSELLSGFNSYEISGEDILKFDYVPGGGSIKLYIWSADGALEPLSIPATVQ